MEWKWHTADRASGEFDDNLAVLRAALKALQSLTSPSASSSLSLEEIAHKSLEEYYQKKKVTEDSDQKSSAAVDFEIGSSAPLQVTPAPIVESKKNNDLDSFMARLEKKASISDSFVKKPAEKAETVTLAPAEVLLEEEEKAPVSAIEDEEKAPAAVAVEETPPAGPAYPKSFNEVMEMLQKGEKVPGIKVIEEKISVDSEEYLKGAAAVTDDEELVAHPSAPSKPWEKVQG